LWERLIASSYVMLDALLVVVLISVGIKRSNYRFDRRLMFIGGAIVAQGIGDYVFVTAGLGRTFGDVQPVYAAPIIAATLFLAAGANVTNVPLAGEYADRTSRRAWATLLPYGLATVLGLALLLRLPRVSANPTDRTLLLAMVVLGALVITRQAVTIRESGRLLDDQRTDLVTSVSHELRTPLTTMVGFLELLNADAFVDAAERREMTSIANRQAAYLSRVVSDLLMLASDTDPEMDLNVEAVPIEELAWCAVDAASIDPSRVIVTADSATTAFLDETRIQQALANFLNNAARYGGGAVEVVAIVDGGDLVLEVHDDGPGVPRKHELRIWEKFERGPHRLNAAVPGSGIGLAVAHAIARSHGGAVGYRKSRRLGGACFWLRLPGRIQADQPVGRRQMPNLIQSKESDVRIA
jgi:signal transduction histidine kinase